MDQTQNKPQENEQQKAPVEKTKPSKTIMERIKGTSGIKGKPSNKLSNAVLNLIASRTTRVRRAPRRLGPQAQPPQYSQRPVRYYNRALSKIEVRRKVLEEVNKKRYESYIPEDYEKQKDRLMMQEKLRQRKDMEDHNLWKTKLVRNPEVKLHFGGSEELANAQLPLWGSDKLLSIGQGLFSPEAFRHLANTRIGGSPRPQRFRRRR